MASPISLTIELSRCWTTDRVMGSILADMPCCSSCLDVLDAGYQSEADTSDSAPDTASMMASISVSVIGVDNAINPLPAASTPRYSGVHGFVRAQMTGAVCPGRTSLTGRQAVQQGAVAKLPYPG